MGHRGLTAFAVIASLVTAVGIFGTFADVVERRTRELGIRAALGATSRDLMHEVFSRASALVAIGLIFGGGLAVVAARLVSAFLFEPRFFDPVGYITVALTLSAVAGAACLIPARRAARADPVVCLRAE